MPVSGSQYDAPHLARNAANFTALTPLGFLARAAAVYPDKVAVIDGARRFTYREFYARCRRFADALRRRGIGPGDTVAVMAPNVPALLEAHYGVPMAGAVLNALNYRLDAALDRLHPRPRRGQAADRRPRVRADRASEALRELGRDMPLVEIADGDGGDAARRHRIRGFPRRGRSGGGVVAAAPTNGRRSRSTTPRAPPATPRASSITTAAPF